MSAISVEVDLSQPLPRRLAGYEVDGDPVYQDMTMQEAIIQAAADKLVNAAKKEMAKAVSEAVDARVDEEIDKHLAEMVRVAFDEERTVTDAWGDVTSEKASLRGLVIERVKQQLTAKPGSSYGPKTVLAKVVEEEVDRTVNTELREAVKAAKAEILVKLQAQTSEVMAKAIMEGLTKR